jgi:tRNA (guanine26-N2/guanine27-N2)-dimethyltransferase
VSQRAAAPPPLPSRRCDEGARQAAAQGKPTPLALSGPMWTGPLHDAAFVAQMAEEAAARGWAGLGADRSSRHFVRGTKKNR